MYIVHLTNSLCNTYHESLQDRSDPQGEPHRIVAGDVLYAVL